MTILLAILVSSHCKDNILRCTPLRDASGIVNLNRGFLALLDEVHPFVFCKQQKVVLRLIHTLVASEFMDMKLEQNLSFFVLFLHRTLVCDRGLTNAPVPVQNVTCLVNGLRGCALITFLVLSDENGAVGQEIPIYIYIPHTFYIMSVIVSFQVWFVYTCTSARDCVRNFCYVCWNE